MEWQLLALQREQQTEESHTTSTATKLNSMYSQPLPLIYVRKANYMFAGPVVMETRLHRLANGEEISQEQFLLSVFFNFVKSVDPIKSQLVNLLLAMRLINDKQNALIRDTTSTVKQANIVWSFLYRIQDDMFWAKCVPLLRIQCPQIVLEAVAQHGTDASDTPVCACHLMEKKLPLAFVCCVFLLAQDTVPDDLYSYLLADVEPSKKWTAIFQLFRGSHSSNKQLQKTLATLLRLFLGPDESQEVQDMLTDSNFTCTCAEQIFCPQMQPVGKINFSASYLASINDDVSAEKSMADFALLPSQAEITDDVSEPLNEDRPPFLSTEQKDDYMRMRAEIDSAISAASHVRFLFRNLERIHHEHDVALLEECQEKRAAQMSFYSHPARIEYLKLLSSFRKAKAGMNCNVSECEQFFPEYWCRQLRIRKYKLEQEFKEAKFFCERAQRLLNVAQRNDSQSTALK